MDSFYTMDRLKSMIESGYALIGRHTYGDVAINGNISKLYIGKFCSIATGLTVFLGNEHSINRVTTYPFCAISRKEEVNMDWGAADISGHPCSKGDVHIANDVWIGAHVTILSGVTVGDGAVIGAHAVVANDVEPYSVVAGNPARFIKWRFPKDVREALLRIQWWEWSDEKIKEAVPLLCSDNIASFITQYETVRNHEIS